MTPINIRETGHHHEVSDEVLRKRLEDATESARYWKRHAASAETPLNRARAKGLCVLWQEQVTVIEREVRRRHRLAAV